MPPIHDATQIIDAVRSLGSVHYPLAAVPGDFNSWRRRLRQTAKRGNVRISVIRAGGLVMVHDPDFVQSEEAERAVMEVLNGIFANEPITYEAASRQQARRRMRLIPGSAER
jgi:hypothetical protein